MMKRSKRGDNRPTSRFNLQMELLEARQLLAADLLQIEPIVDPFARDAVTFEQVSERAKSQAFVPGELLVAVEVEAIDPTVATVLRPTWSTQFVQNFAKPAKTLIDFGTSESTSFQLVQIDLGSDVDVLSAMQRLDESYDVLWSQPNFIHEGPDPREYTPNDPQYGNQYHHPLIGNDVAWDVTFGDSDIIIGITDDGVDIQHEDLAASIWTNPGEIAGDGIDNDGNGYIDDVNGWNFLNGNNNPDALAGDDHGTHVSGIAAGITDNATGIAGTAGGATILPLKWYDGGTWTAAIIAETFTYAADNGVNIVNTSYNMDVWANDAVVHAAFEYMYDAGVLHFNSAGNGNTLNPARQVFEESILVASTDSGDVRSGFSNYGVGIDIASPGSDILSSTPGDNYEEFSGTSMASPNAAGVAALIWSANPTWTREQVVAQLMSTADNIDGQNGAFVNLLGQGRVNSGRGVTEAIAAPQVAFVNNIPESGMATVTDMIEDFYLVYDQFMDAASVTDANSYELRDAGADGVFDTADDQVFSLTVSSEYLTGTNGIQVDIAGGPLGIGEYRFSIVSGGVENPFATPLDGNGDGIGGDNYERFISISIEPFVSTGILAGLSSVSANNPGSLDGAADSDAYTFFAEAGESVTAIVTPLNPATTITGAFPGLGSSATSAAPGESVVISLAAVASTGNVTFQVTGDQPTSYHFDVYRNTNIKDLGGDTGSVINIQDSYLQLGSGRLAAIGQSNGLTAGEQFLQSNDPSKFIDISATGTALGLGDDSEATITTTVGNVAFPAGNVTVGNNGGIIAAAGEDLSSGNGALPNSNWDTALLPFWDDIDSDSGDVYWQEIQVSGINTLIVQWNDRPRFNNVGDATFQVQVFESGSVLARFAYQDVDFGNSIFDNGGSATIGYQQSTSSALSYSFNTASIANGDVLDLVDTKATTDVEEYSFNATALDSIDIMVDGISTSFTSELVELIDSSGNVVATGSPNLNGFAIDNVDQAIAGYVPTSSGIYRVRITTNQTAKYAVLVTENLTYDLEPNDTAAAIVRSLDKTGAALGSLDSGALMRTQYNDPSAFVDISATGTALGLGDDGEATVLTTIGNDIFPSGSITIANNGGIIAGSSEELVATNETLPNTAWNTALLPFWDDIDDGTGDVYWEELQVGGINTLIVQWHNLPHYEDIGSATFQVQIFESGPVAARFAYSDVIFGDSSSDNGVSATVGAQVSQTNSLTVSQDIAAIFDGDVIDITSQESDVYSITLVAGESVQVETATPLDHASHVPANLLDPKLEVLDSAGNQVSMDQNSANDGKNAALTFTAPTDGTYYVSVAVESGSGAYVLSVDSATTVDGDFNLDGIYDCNDIDLLTLEVISGDHDIAYDLTGDGLVNLDDRDAWLLEGGIANGHSTGYILGDTNLDGNVDGIDFLIWNVQKFSPSSGYCSSDINMDGVVDGRDFFIWNLHKFTSTQPFNLISSGSQAEGGDVIEASMLLPNEAVTKAATPALPSRVDAAFANYKSNRISASEPPVDDDAGEALATEWRLI